MSTASRGLALARYRGLLRAARKTFHGDVYAVAEAKKELRSQFEAGRRLERDEDVREALQAAEDAEDFLLNNVSQAQINERGNFAVELEDPSTTEKIAVSDKHANFTVLQSDDPLPQKPTQVNVISSSDSKSSEK